MPRSLAFLLLFSLFAFQKNQKSSSPGWLAPSPAVAVLLERAEHFRKKDAPADAFSTFEKAAETARVDLDFGGAMQAEIACADLLTDRPDNAAALEKLLAAIRFFEQKGTAMTNENGWLHCWAALVHNFDDRAAEAQRHYLTAIGIFEQNRTVGPKTAFAYKNLAAIKTKQLDYPAAFDLLEKADRADPGGKYAQHIHSNFARVLFHTKKFADAIRHCEKGLAADGDDWDRAELLGLAADAHIENGALDRAADALQKARQLAFSDEGLADHRMGFCSSTALLFERQNRPREAEFWHQKAITEAAANPQTPPREAAKMHVRFADFLTRKGQTDRAVAELQKAIGLIFPNFSTADPLQNPPLEAAYAESFGMTAPARKAALLLEKGQKAADLIEKKRLLTAAAGAFELAFACVDRLREGYGDEAAKLFLGDYVHDYLEKALETRRQLFELEPQNEVHAAAFFQLSEANRAVVLGEAVRKNRSFAALGLPDSLREREADGRRLLADLQAQKVAAPTDSARADLAEKIARADRDRSLFMEKMDADWPELRRLREAPTLPSLAEMRQKLGPDAAFLSFFEGSDGLFIFAVEGEKSAPNSTRAGPTIRRLPLDSIQNDLAEFAAFFAEKGRIDAAPARFFELSSRLFQRLVPLEKLPRRLVVAPDGAVGFVPFDALLSEKWGGLGFSNAPFLVQKTAVEQAWSAAIWAAPFSKKEPSGGERLQFSPIFEKGQRGLAPLLFSQKETEKADFEAIMNDFASAHAFFEKAKKPLGALHLSTHATASDAQPRLEFADRSAGLAEIFGASIPADLVVLSACETGIGRATKSEGLQSLARAFAYAGARSLVASLWSVNERSTASLFALFYEKLSDGRSTPSEALRASKRAFLADETTLDAQKSPYFWAGFVPTGEQFPLKKPRSSWPFWSLLAASGAGLLAFLRLRKKPVQ